jgi:hypothetical protein
MAAAFQAWVASNECVKKSRKTMSVNTSQAKPANSPHVGSADWRMLVEWPVRKMVFISPAESARNHCQMFPRCKRAAPAYPVGQRQHDSSDGKPPDMETMAQWLSGSSCKASNYSAD